MSGRRRSFGVLGVGTVSVSDAQDVDTAAGGMAFDRLIIPSYRLEFRSLRSIKQCHVCVPPNPMQIARFCYRLRVSLLLHTTRTCTCTYMPSPRAQFLIKSLSGVD